MYYITLCYIKLYYTSGPGSVVGIATGYRLDGPGIEYQWGRVFPHLSRQALRPTQPPVQWVPGLSRGIKSCWGVTLTPQPLLVLWSRKSRAIPLLPLWAVRPVQSLSACARVHFTFFILYYINMWLHVLTNYMVILRSYKHTKTKLQLQISFSATKKSQSYCFTSSSSSSS